MLTGHYPEELRQVVLASHGRAIIVPAVSIGDLYSWIGDADIGLLPYEDEIDPNVRFCAPQKLFDYLACGVPFIGSRRPSIAAVAAEVGCGVCIDMTDGAALAAAVTRLAGNAVLRVDMAAMAQKAHIDKYHYNGFIAPILSALL
jgi:glycosyltransferase involved in cell wall biosynthesis